MTIQWRDVILGAAVTAVLFTLDNILLGLYLGKASFSSTYGAAASTVVLTLWVYYSSQIFFLGAEFTKAYAQRHGLTGEARIRLRQIAEFTSHARFMCPLYGSGDLEAGEIKVYGCRGHRRQRAPALPVERTVIGMLLAIGESMRV